MIKNITKVQFSIIWDDKNVFYDESKTRPNERKYMSTKFTYHPYVSNFDKILTEVATIIIVIFISFSLFLIDTSYSNFAIQQSIKGILLTLVVVTILKIFCKNLRHSVFFIQNGVLIKNSLYKTKALPLSTIENMELISIPLLFKGVLLRGDGSRIIIPLSTQNVSDFISDIIWILNSSGECQFCTKEKIDVILASCKARGAINSLHDRYLYSFIRAMVILFFIHFFIAMFFWNSPILLSLYWGGIGALSLLVWWITITFIYEQNLLKRLSKDLYASWNISYESVMINTIAVYIVVTLIVGIYLKNIVGLFVG